MITRTINLGDTEMKTFTDALQGIMDRNKALMGLLHITDAEKNMLAYESAIIQSVQAQVEEWQVVAAGGAPDWGAGG